MSAKNHNTSAEVLLALREVMDQKRAASSVRFFKTGEGEYGEGDRFLGVTVPLQRQIAKRFHNLSLNELVVLLRNPYHEARLTAILILVGQFEKGSLENRKVIFEKYLANTKFINNWDIVDSSAHKIVGPYLTGRPEQMEVLYSLAQSPSIWERRIAIISTAYNIGKLHSATEALSIAELLLNDREDLIHKAVGWMLREIGKNIDESLLRKFLDEHATKMPRTALRYAIERFDYEERRHYLGL